jgi:hypothetical protein
MEFIMKVWAWISGQDGAILFACLFAVSEALALIPAVKANSVYQLIAGWLKSAKEKNPVVQ